MKSNPSQITNDTVKLKRTLFLIIVLLCFKATQSISQPCITYPGYTTWLGYTDAWADSSNWCPAIAPVNINPAMNVRIPGGPSGPYTYFRPVISSGVYALAEKLRVEASDTIFIQAGTQSSLTVNDSLKILNSSSAIIVGQPNLDTVQLSSGTFNFPDDSPLNQISRSRSLMVITQAELQAQGLQTGDVICKILFHVQRKSNGNPYKNCTIKYYYTTNNQGIFGTGFSANIPSPVGAPGTLFSGDLQPSAFIPTMNDYGTIEVVLQNPFAWTGTSNALVIELCYDNTGFASTGFNDEPRFTQTGILNRYLSIRALTNYPLAGCNLSPKDTIVVQGTWSTGTTTIILASSAQAANVLPGMISYPDGRTVVSVVGNIVTMNSVNAGNGANKNIVFSNVKVISSNFRPNMTFVKNCQSAPKYPIYVRGHWENNGTFVSGYSRTIFDGVVINQEIGGQSKTTFYDLDISNVNHVIRLTDFTVEDSLRLLDGRLKMNLGMMTLLKSGFSAITRTNGFIQCETDQIASNVFPFGRINWKMGSLPGLRLIPIVSHSGVYIPLDYTIVSGTHDVVLGTYGTFPDNTNLPLPEVTNVIAFNGVSYDSSGASAADRFFLIKDSLGINPVASVAFRYANSERALNNPLGNILMGAQRWINVLDQWENPLLPGQTYFAGAPDAVNLTIDDAVFNTSDWWTVTMVSSPLSTGLLEPNSFLFSLNPNPAFPGDVLNPMINDATFLPETVRILSMQGRVIVNEQIDIRNGSIQIPNDFIPGVYIFQIKSKKKYATMKLVVLNR